MTVNEVLSLLSSLPAGLVWSAIAVCIGGLATAGGVGFWLVKLLHAHELINLHNQIESQKDEIRLLRQQPSATISVKSIEEPLNRVAKFLRTSFTGEPYIHPRVIEELRGWLSDSDSDIAAIDVASALESNKYRDPIRVQSYEHELWVEAIDQIHKSSFSYRFLGRSPAGVHAIVTTENGGGSGTFFTVMFLVFQLDQYIDLDETKPEVRDRILLKCVGKLSLGDRYDGDLRFDNGRLFIGERRAFFPEYQSVPRVIMVE